ncbi:MAG: AraC family transcriptional regulator [Bacteroidia bacterium]|nr:AraC family transcriptional regulator [Bacteroidia bacterium]
MDYYSLEIQGKTVFEKITLRGTGRLPKKLKNEACFMFLLKGSFVVRTPVTAFSLSPQEGFLSRCGEYLMENVTTLQDGDEVIEAIGIYFHPEIIREMFLYHPVPSKNNLPHTFSIDKILDHYKEGLIYYLNHPGIFSIEMQMLKIKELLLILIRFSEAPTFHHFLTALFSPYEFQFREVVETHLFSSMSLAQLAFLAGMSLATFKRRFQELYKISPAEYIKKRKLEKAAGMLLIREVRINEIVFECGFESTATFNRLFKKQFGKSPSEYRLSQIET